MVELRGLNKRGILGSFVTTFVATVLIICLLFFFAFFAGALKGLGLVKDNKIIDEKYDMGSQSGFSEFSSLAHTTDELDSVRYALGTSFQLTSFKSTLYEGSSQDKVRRVIEKEISLNSNEFWFVFNDEQIKGVLGGVPDMYRGKKNDKKRCVIDFYDDKGKSLFSYGLVVEKVSSKLFMCFQKLTNGGWEDYSTLRAFRANSFDKDPEWQDEKVVNSFEERIKYFLKVRCPDDIYK